jgi:hypothetical protein
VLIIATAYYVGGGRAGEDVWAGSTIQSLTDLGYTILYGLGHMEALLIYQYLPELIDIIIVDTKTLRECISRSAENYLEQEDPLAPGLWQDEDRIGCIKKDGFEEGVPVWKLFPWHIWGGVRHPFGSNWTLSIADYAKWDVGNYWLGEMRHISCMGGAE